MVKELSLRSEIAHITGILGLHPPVACGVQLSLSAKASVNLVRTPLLHQTLSMKLVVILLFTALSHAQQPSPDSPAQDFIKAAAELPRIPPDSPAEGRAATGREASELADLVAFNQALKVLNASVDLPTLSSLFPASPLDYRSISSIGEKERLSESGLLTGYDLCVAKNRSTFSCP